MQFEIKNLLSFVQVETFFPPLVDKVAEPDPWGPPPEDGGVEEEHEEEMEEEGLEEFSEEMEIEEDDQHRMQSSIKPEDVDMMGDEGPPPSTQESKEGDVEKEKEDKEKDDKEKDTLRRTSSTKSRKSSLN